MTGIGGYCASMRMVLTRFRVSQSPRSSIEKIRASRRRLAKTRFMLREVLARNGIDVRRVTCLGMETCSRFYQSVGAGDTAYEREVARIKGANRPMERLGPSAHEMNLERMRLSLSNVAERPGLGG